MLWYTVWIRAEELRLFTGGESEIRAFAIGDVVLTVNTYYELVLTYYDCSYRSIWQDADGYYDIQSGKNSVKVLFCFTKVCLPLDQFMDYGSIDANRATVIEIMTLFDRYSIGSIYRGQYKTLAVSHFHVLPEFKPVLGGL